MLAERDKVPWQEGVGWVTEVAAGLGALHTLGAVHGGVSPHTVIVTPDESVRLVDAGLARASWPADLTSLDPPRAAYYKTPEEVLARELSPASDVYALGLLLYRLVTGAPAFDGRTALEVAERQVGTDPELPRRLTPDLPESLERVVIHALAKQPEDRYATADLMRRDLERVVAGSPVAAPPAPGSEPLPEPTKLASEAPIASSTTAARHRLATWALGTAIVAALLIVALLWSFGAFTEKVPVPDLTGMNVAQARTALAEARLELGAVSLEPAPVGTIPATIFAQDPAAGDKVGVGSRVNVRVAGTASTTPGATPTPGTSVSPGASVAPGEITTIAPTVIGLGQAEAEQAIATAGLVLDEHALRLPPHRRQRRGRGPGPLGGAVALVGRDHGDRRLDGPGGAGHGRARRAGRPRHQRGRGRLRPSGPRLRRRHLGVGGGGAARRRRLRPVPRRRLAGDTGEHDHPLGVERRRAGARLADAVASAAADGRRPTPAPPPRAILTVRAGQALAPPRRGVRVGLRSATGNRVGGGKLSRGFESPPLRQKASPSPPPHHPLYCPAERWLSG